MARKSILERIAQLEAQKKTLQARLGKQERAADTRRKVLLGALVLHRLEAGDDPEFSQKLRDWLRRELPGFLVRDGDKALFADLLAAPAQDVNKQEAANPNGENQEDDRAAKAPHLVSSTPGAPRPIPPMPGPQPLNPAPMPLTSMDEAEPVPRASSFPVRQDRDVI